MEKNMIKLVQPQITDLKYRKKLLKDKNCELKMFKKENDLSYIHIFLIEQETTCLIVLIIAKQD